MRAPLETTPRERWEDIVSQYPPAAGCEYRRKQPRHDVVLATVKFTFEQRGRRTVRVGKLLNASPNGVLIRQHEVIDDGTTVLMQVMIAEETVVLVGRVMHCTQAVGGYKLGVALQFAGEGD